MYKAWNQHEVFGTLNGIVFPFFLYMLRTVSLLILVHFIIPYIFQTKNEKLTKVTEVALNLIGINTQFTQIFPLHIYFSIKVVCIFKNLWDFDSNCIKSINQFGKN